MIDLSRAPPSRVSQRRFNLARIRLLTGLVSPKRPRATHRRALLLGLASLGIAALSSICNAFGDTQGPLYAGSAADGGDGTRAWANSSNAAGSNTTTFAEATLNNSADTTNTLRLTNFGFSIPAGSTINGVVVSVYKGASFIVDSSVRLIVGGASSGSNKADMVTSWPSTAADVSYGGASDLWGNTLSANDINATNFGFAISATNTNNGTKRPQVYRVGITIHFTALATNTPTTTPHKYTHADADFYADSHSDNHSNSYAHRDSNLNDYANPHSYTNYYSHPDVYNNSNAESFANTN